MDQHNGPDPTGADDQREPDPDRLETWLTLASAGYALAPVRIERNPATGRKMPTYGALWSKVSTQDPEVITEWATDPRRSMLVDCSASGVLVVDLDVKPHADPDRAVDGTTTWAELGLPTSPMRVETPSGGQHHYWRMPDPPLINSEGLIGRGIDTRGAGGHVFAPGAFIVGDPGPGYVLLDPLVPAAELPTLPDEIAARLRSAPASGVGEGCARADGESHDVAWVEARVDEHLGNVREHNPRTGGFRAVLRGASLILGRAVAGDVLERTEAEKLLGDAVFGVWGSVDSDDVTWISTGLDDGVADPWTITHGTAARATLGRSVAEYAGWDPEEDPEDVQYARELGAEVRRERMRREVRRLLDAEARGGQRAPLAELVLDVNDLDEIERPAALLGGFLDAGRIAVLAGKFGTFKSFLALSWACSIASGRNWQDRPEWAVPAPAPVLYVAAEGADGMWPRVRAWSRRYGEIPRGMLRFLPVPARINDPHDVAELGALIESTGTRLVILDTLHRSAPGADEMSNTDMGRVFDAVAGLRDRYGVAVVLIHHTGHGGERSRGASSIEDDADASFVIRLDGDDRSASAQRTLVVRKRKDAASEGEYPLTWRADEIESGYVELTTALEPSASEVPEWWTDAMDDALSDEILAAIDGATGARGKGAARDLARYMRHVGEVDGAGRTRADVVAALRECPRNWGRESAKRGWDVLRAAGLLEPERVGTTPEGRHRWLAPDPEPGRT